MYNHNKEHLPEAVNIPKSRLRFLKNRAQDIINSFQSNSIKSERVEEIESILNDANLTNKELAFIVGAIVDFAFMKSMRVLGDVVLSAIDEKTAEEDENNKSDIMYR